MFEAPVARLRDLSTAGAGTRVVPTLVLPPQAGHDSCIVDYSPQQSQMRTILDAGLTRAFSLDWIGASARTRDATVDDYLDVIDRAVDHAGGRVNLIGDCQGGWLATIYAALAPERINTLTIAGAPISLPCRSSTTISSDRLAGFCDSAVVLCVKNKWPGNRAGDLPLLERLLDAAQRRAIGFGISLEGADLRDDTIHLVDGGPLLRGVDLGAQCLQLVERVLIVMCQLASGVVADEDVDGIQQAAELASVAGYVLDDPALQRGIAGLGAVDIDEPELIAAAADQRRVDRLRDIAG